MYKSAAFQNELKRNMDMMIHPKEPVVIFQLYPSQATAKALLWLKNVDIRLCMFTMDHI